MKIDPSDNPNGLRDVDGEDAEALEELARGIRGRGPSVDAVQRISKRLAAVGALPPASVSDAQPVTPSAATARFAGNVGSFKIGGLALAALTAGALLAWRATYTTESAPSAAPTEIASPAAPTVVAEPLAARASNDTVTAPTELGTTRGAASVPAVSIDSLPSVAPVARAPGSSTTTDNRGATTAAPEHLLVRRAQDALTSDPAQALMLANEHAARYPAGELTQEREVVAVDALAKLGRKDDALARARALVRRFPRTPYVAHLEKAVGPLTAAGSDSRSTP